MRYTALDWAKECREGIRRLPRILFDGKEIDGLEYVMAADEDAGYIDVADLENCGAAEFRTIRRYGVVKINFTYV